MCVWELGEDNEWSHAAEQPQPSGELLHTVHDVAWPPPPVNTIASAGEDKKVYILPRIRRQSSGRRHPVPRRRLQCTGLAGSGL